MGGHSHDASGGGPGPRSGSGPAPGDGGPPRGIGAASAHHARDVRRVACAIVTVSDSRTPDTDTSGNEIRAHLEAAGHVVDDYRIVPDEPALVRSLLEAYATAGRVDAVLLSGGTGVAARDTTFEAVAALLTKRIDGFGELFRMLSYGEIGAAAMLSRAVAGLAGTMAVFSMPGSTAACRLAMERLVVPQLAHVVGLARPREQA